jgi:hypothetical protein
MVNARRAALELLGLDPGEPLTHDRLRRAYLRRLRAYPPERDPDGFRRLREAFEQLEPLARIHDQIRARQPSGVTLDAAAPGAWAHDADETDETDETDEAGRPAHDADATGPAPAIAMELVDGQRVERRPDAGPRPTGWTWRSSEPAPSATSARPADATQPDEPAGRVEAPRADDRGVPRDASAFHDARSHDAPDEPGDRSGGSVGVPEEPTTLRGVTDEILARFERGEPDAALALADRGSRSEIDDHREVSAHEAQRWALTRELLDVADGLPDSLRRAIAHGIAADDLGSAGAAADAYRARYPSKARDLSWHLAKRARNLHKAVGAQLHSATPRGDASPSQSSRTSRAPIWIVVVIASALVRAAGTCRDSSRTDYLAPQPELRWNGHGPLPRLDRDRLLPNDPRLDPDLYLRTTPRSSGSADRSTHGSGDLRLENDPPNRP